MYQLIHGDCLEELKKLSDNSIDSIVTDPPYGLSFMGKKWDYDVPSEEVWKECLRVLKPGGHLLAFAGTRTQHRMAVRIEDAGFEIRDMIMYVYGQGFPKSTNIYKQFQKMCTCGNMVEYDHERTAQESKHQLRPQPIKQFTGEPCAFCKQHGAQEVRTRASEIYGFGSALKPACEPITVARKPLSEKNLANNVLEYGTGGINIDGCRVPAPDAPDEPVYSQNAGSRYIGVMNGGKQSDSEGRITSASSTGRFPANLIHDGSEEVVGLFPVTGGGGKPKPNPKNDTRTINMVGAETVDYQPYADTLSGGGSAARFFYCAKASKRERNMGLVWNTHPTVKPADLMAYLCRLVTPTKGKVLDPFMGSGSTGIACVEEGFDFIGIEREKEYIEIAEHRIRAATPK